LGDRRETLCPYSNKHLWQELREVRFKGDCAREGSRIEIYAINEDCGDLFKCTVLQETGKE
jgi:hypothetical protein